jgi:hypothetical protein
MVTNTLTEIVINLTIKSIQVIIQMIVQMSIFIKFGDKNIKLEFKF